VLLREVLSALAPGPGGVYMDCTYGRGGHSRALLERLGPGGRVIALDRDPEAVADARRLAAGDGRFVVEQASFAALARIAEAHGVTRQVDGILFDLGVSSPQLEDPERGFAFRADGPLDMRMDPGAGRSASDWLAEAPEEEIASVLRRYGEEPAARRIARAIVARRVEAPITRTGELASLIARCVPARGSRGGSRIHPATRSFQAIRIHVNRELEALEAALDSVPAVLAPGGRLVVISFHSLEDRLVKRFIRRQARGPVLPRGLPVAEDGFRPVLRPLDRGVRPGDAERVRNPRARSAVLRAAERLS
jgi:16S rRNA (cytosine1402-N4)-methyltransferase